MTQPVWLWAAFTFAASTSQSLRNAFQHDLVERIGAAKASFTRFLFGFPFALFFLGIAVAAYGAPPAPGLRVLAATALAAATQVLATALMLLAMRDRSFIVATTIMKTEPLMIIPFGVAFFGASAGPALYAAACLATLGVFIAALPSAAALAAGTARRGALFGLGAAALFGVATLAYREAVIAVETPHYPMAAAETTALALALQTACILLWLGVFDRPGLFAIAREWRGSLGAGFMGAAATALQFLALALASAAAVRTLGLIEVPMATLISRKMFRAGASAREWLGIALTLLGVALALQGG